VTWPAGFAIHERAVTPDPELVDAMLRAKGRRG
jgi:hypothetical protein